LTVNAKIFTQGEYSRYFKNNPGIYGLAIETMKAT
jgi:hypothetical protein